ncbi:hypothetical protein [Parvibaculum sp.]|uniref:hypothetical protein n=1 Tax=Parvibaculum sp. TaxID=2024848 RepID=UPI003C775174
MTDWLMQQLEAKCRENYGKWPDSPYGQSALESDERAARHNGARITDIVRLCEGVSYEAGSPIYRRYRRGLEAAVAAGKAAAWRPGASAYVFYWPIGLSAALRHEAGQANG